jgi:hypothetical protein
MNTCPSVSPVATSITDSDPVGETDTPPSCRRVAQAQRPKTNLGAPPLVWKGGDFDFDLVPDSSRYSTGSIRTNPASPLGGWPRRNGPRRIWVPHPWFGRVGILTLILSQTALANPPDRLSRVQAVLAHKTDSCSMPTPQDSSPGLAAPDCRAGTPAFLSSSSHCTH